ncbi:MAG: DUF3488 domain-containing protein, partial [Planctomycetaceae bacterium]|nr:DUF3488 domain-containing protein [Planctomycetaceae bacterium]
MQFALQLTVAVVVSMAGVVLAMAETEDPSGSPLAAFSVPVAILTLLLVDRQRLLRLPDWAAAFLGLLAFGVAVQEFFSDAPEARLLSASHLIVYLTWIFLVQVKAARHYWWLHALSLLQIAVASVLTSKPWFGLALLVFVLLMNWSLALFLVNRTLRPSMQAQAWARDTKDVGQSRQGVVLDAGQRLLNWRFVGNSFTLSCLGLVFSVLFFLFTPRIWLSGTSIASDSRGGRGGVTGFSESVRLGDLGSVLESTEPALEVKVFNTTEDREFTRDETIIFMREEPLFRGAVLETYTDGSWARRDFEDDYNLPPFESLPAEFKTMSPVKQQMKLYPNGSNILFTYGTVFTVDGGDTPMQPVREYLSNEIKLNRSFGWNATTYWVYEYPNDPRDVHRLLGLQTSRQFFFEYIRRMTRIREELRNRLTPYTREVLGDARADAEIAERIREHLQDSGEFSYTLDLSIEDPTIDPVEDFLVNRKAGHCEYFASAMALMLRSAGVPARVITGFKGGAWDDGRQAYVVQQLHSHAWVEAFVQGRWVTYDPTPATREETVRQLQGNAPAGQTMTTVLKSWWSQGVAMNMYQQQEMLYNPVAMFSSDAWSRYGGPLAALFEFGQPGAGTPTSKLPWGLILLPISILL